MTVKRAASTCAQGSECCHRVRETNPYLLLEEDEGGLDTDTDFSSGEVRTELGLLSSTSDKTFDEPEQLEINHNYSLGDEDEEDVQPQKARVGLMGRSRSGKISSD